INLFSDMPEDIGLIVPSGHRALLYTEKEVRSWIKEAFGSPVEPYVMETVPYSLISTDELSLLKEQTYIDKGNEKFGARKFVLDNGVKIVLKSYKPSPGLNMDKIMLHGFSDKGANCFPEEDYFS